MTTDLVPITSTNIAGLEESIASGGMSSSPAAISAGAGEWIEVVEVQIKVTFDSAPSANGNTVDLYGANSADGGTTTDQDAGSKDVGQNFKGTICDDSDASTNSYTKTILVLVGRYEELLIANTTGVSVTVNSVYYTGIKVVNS